MKRSIQRSANRAPRACAVAGAALLAAALGGGAAHAGNVCGEWQHVPSPEPGIFTQLRDVAVISATDVWAVGWTDDDETMALHWDGTSWTRWPTPSPSISFNTLEAVAAVSSDEVWAAGAANLPTPPTGSVRPHLLVIRWDGAAWELMDAPPLPIELGGAKVRSIEVLGPDDIWFGGDWGGTALAMRWNGADFEIVPTPTFDTGCSGTFGCGHAIEDMAALAPDDIWAVGGAADGDSSAVSQIFHWDGSAWSHLPGPAPGFYHRLWGVAALAPDDVWAVGGMDDPDENDPLVLHWDGSGWTQVFTPQFTQAQAELNTIVALAPDDIWAAGVFTVQPPPDTARPLAMHYDGTDWIQVPMDPDGPISGWMRGLAAAGPCDVWAVGSGGGAHIQRLHPTSGLPGDLDGDGIVGILDFLALLAAWGPCGDCGDCPADLDGDCAVGVNDFLILLANWG